LLKLTSNSSLIFNDYENHIKGRSYTEDVWEQNGVKWIQWVRLGSSGMLLWVW
jgi:hypothetical protein